MARNRLTTPGLLLAAAQERDMHKPITYNTLKLVGIERIKVQEVCSNTFTAGQLRSPHSYHALHYMIVFSSASSEFTIAPNT